MNSDLDVGQSREQLRRAQYQRAKEDARRRQMEKSIAGRDIKEKIIPVADSVRRETALGDLLVFLTTYFPMTFTRPFSKDHLTIIAKLQHAIRHGGKYACCMPRSGGKTQISLRAALWAILCGHRRFVLLIGADQKLTKGLMATLKMELQTNALLRADFPSSIVPLQELGSHSGPQNQLYDGASTYAALRTDRVQFATMPTEDNLSNGSIIMLSPILSAARGMQIGLPDGSVARPDLVFLDDPETRTSAKSNTQNETRHRIVSMI